jgi:methyltransferase family protein
MPLPFGDGEFDRVFTSNFFHHLQPDGRAAFVAEARRVGSELVVVEGADKFTPTELADELGNTQVLHEGRWFTVVAS